MNAISFRFAVREFRSCLKSFRILVICLGMGVMALTAVGLIRDSIKSGLQFEAKELLGGDANIELTYRFASPQETIFFSKTTEKYRSIRKTSELCRSFALG